MDRDGLRVGIYNFFVSMRLVLTVIFSFIMMWLSTSSAVTKASKIFSERIVEMGLPEATAKKLTEEYKSAKDYIFEGFLKRKDNIKRTNPRKTGGLQNILIKMLPGGQVFLRIRNGDSKGIRSAVVLDATKTIILLVGVARASVRDIYWVAVSFASYFLYSLLFGLASELITKHQDSSKGLLGSAVNTIRDALSDTKVIAIVSLALSSHVILGAPFVPLYHIIPGLDFVEHYISGFGIGLFVAKTYKSFISYISYSKALTILGSMESDYNISLFEASAELPFICFSSIFVGSLWEGLEEIAEIFTPRVVNIFFWNGVGDILMGLLGALTAYTLVSYSFIIRRQENRSNPDVRNSKIDPRAVMRASDSVLKHMKDVMSNVYSEGTAREVSEVVGKYHLTKGSEGESARVRSLSL